ncbi:MAG: hypothetical protein ACYDB4_19390 [Candidatus Dormibacteraceae bacterium]
MTGKTVVAEPEVTDAAELEAEYQRLSYEVSQGNGVSAVKLAKIEERIEDARRKDRRAAAAAAEAARLAADAEAQAKVAERQAQEAAYRSALQAQRTAFDQVEQTIAEAAVAIQAALIAGDEVWSCALRLSHSPGRTAKSLLTDYVGWKLGRDGAGLSDMPSVLPAFRQPLVQPLNPKES